MAPAISLGGMRPEGHPGDGATLNEHLVAAVPPTAKTVLQVGLGGGWTAEMLKTRRPPPVVYGADFPAMPVTQASDLAGYFGLDLERDNVPLDPGSVDTIVYADVLSRVADPLAMLRRHRPLLRPGGNIVCSVPNVQHHGVVSGILRGILPYTEGTLLDPAYLRLFTSESVVQLLLDAGYAPNTVARAQDEGTDGVAEAGGPLFELLGVGAKDAELDLRTTRLVVTGAPLPEVEGPEVPMTFVACVNDDAQLDANLRRSPCLRGDTQHELLVFRNCATAAEGLNAGIEQARHELVVLVHQDVYLPDRWPARLTAQWHLAQSQGGSVGIAGVFGVLDRRVPFDAIGRVVHRDRLLSHRNLPCDVDGLDELLMVVPRDTPLRVDPELGWHLYGTDLALQAQDRNLRVVVVDSLCHHNSLTGRVPWKYRESERVLARKWKGKLPIHTNLSSIDAWLLDAEVLDEQGQQGEQGERAVDDRPHPQQPDSVADLVTRLRREQVALNAELEQARLQVASMKASPFWRAREVYARIRGRWSHRR